MLKRASIIKLRCFGCGNSFTRAVSYHRICQRRNTTNRFFCGRRCSANNKIKPASERFWSKVLVTSPDACWLWVGCRAPNGYGRIIKSESTKLEIASRISYEIAYGSIPKNMLVCHRCDNPPCVNPNHLFLGTAQDNQLDCIAKKRNVYGEKQWCAKVTEIEVRAIRKAREHGVMLKDLANKYGIGITTVEQIVKRHTWKHVV